MNLSPPLLSSQNDRLYKIVMECLDAAFNVCNNNLDQFTDSKIFDVFDQIFPSASVLNTGYWIFFVSNYGASLCVCGRFGIVCRHVRSKNHWIDLQPMVERSGATVFIPKIYGPVIPTRYEITVNYMSEIFGYMIDMDMDLTYAADMCKQKHRVHIQARYGYANQWYGAPYSIRFTPNPILKEQYGKYFDKLRNHRLFITNKHCHEDLIVTPSTMPPSCLLLISVNVAKHEIPSNISAILMNADVKPPGGCFHDVSTQTIRNEDLNDYANLLHEVASRIWGCHNTSETKFPIFDEYFKNSLPYTAECPEYPIGINDTEEYDIEFPEFNNGKSMYKRNNRKTISEQSIPKPISSVHVQNSKFIPRTEKLHSMDQTALPNFEDAFLNQELVAPMYEISLKRKRGRPKVVRAKSYSMATRCENMTYSEKPRSPLDNSSCEKTNEISNFSDTKQEINDSSFTRLNNIFEQSNEINVSDQIKDINFELDIIDQLIREDSEKNKSQNH